MADKYLILHTWGIGDMILLTPVLEIIHHRFPKLIFDFVIFQGTAKLPIQNAPYTGEIHPGSYRATKLLLLILGLRKRRYDYCVTTSGISPTKAGLFARLIKAKRRIGDAPQGSKQVYTDQLPFLPYQHRTRANYELFRLLFDIPEVDTISPDPKYRDIYRTRYYSAPSAATEAYRYFESHFADSDFVVAIHPGCNAKNKYRRWDLDNFVELIGILNKAFPAWKFYVIAGPDELEEGTLLSEKIAAPCLSGVSLDTVAEALKRSSMLINTDSGIGHIASCHRLPSFVIFGPGDERQTAPFGDQATVIRSDTPCAPCVQNKRIKCDTECLKNLFPQTVADIIRTHYQEKI